MGQSITINAPVRCLPRGDKQWAISGTPADCVILALTHLMKESPPAIILSGINAGRNMGDEVNLSGTLGAAFTRADARHARNRDQPGTGQKAGAARWNMARKVLPDIIANFLHEGWDSGHCLSINLPDIDAADIKGISWTPPPPSIRFRLSAPSQEPICATKIISGFTLKEMKLSSIPAATSPPLPTRTDFDFRLTLDRSIHVMQAPFGKKTANDE